MISIGITPFVNDTFAFVGIAKELIKTNLKYSTSYYDLEELNFRSIQEDGDILKISFNTLGKILDNYILLPVGSCLGFHNGPKIVAKRKFPLSELNNKRIGIPGTNTSSYMLFKLLTPAAREELIFPYQELPDQVLNDNVDCALTIHESRFQIEEMGLTEIGDLFDLWAERTAAPLPLGGIVAKRSLGAATISQIILDIKQSLLMANKQNLGLNYAQEFSFNKDLRFIKKNIDLYVNEETLDLSSTGIGAIQTLLDLGYEAGFFPKPRHDWLF